LNATIIKEVEKLINAQIILHVTYYEWVSNLVLVRKKNGDIGLCVDFCALSRESVKHNFPLLNMELILQQGARLHVMSLLDGFLGYNQIRVKRDDKYKTTFTTWWGTFVYEIMYFVLINTCVIFQSAMQITFNDLIGKIIKIYLDDLTVYSRNRQDHFDHLRNIFLCCIKFRISLNPMKTIFGVTQGKILIHIVSYLRISIDHERVIAIQSLQSPSSKKEIQSFMGKINFVRKFIHDFAKMGKPIHNMLKQY
jgi:hypothetical protein